jgi:multiple sugar transport system permease protein
MFEAADLDGAGIFSKAFRFTLPMLRPLIIINLVGAFIGSFKAMENIFVMTGGGPLNRTHTLGLEIWYNAFLYLKYGYATAAAWVMGAMLIAFTMYQLRILRNVRFTTAGR